MDAWALCQTKEAKHEFFAKYKLDRKFDFTTVAEVNSRETHVVVAGEEGWMSKFQVAQKEALPADSELLAELLAELPQRAHRSSSWAAKGEKEYYYKDQTKIKNDEVRKEGLVLDTRANTNKAVCDQMAEGFRLQNKAPLLSLEDSHAKMTEEEKAEALKQEGYQKDFKEGKVALQKVEKVMATTLDSSQKLGAKLQAGIEKKPYFAHIKEELDKQHQSFASAKKEITNKLAVFEEVEGGTEEKVKELEDCLEIAKNHLQAFRSGVYKEAAQLLK